MSPYAFFRCSAIEGVYITDLKAWCDMDRNIEAQWSCLEPNNLYLNGELLKNAVIPENTKKITAWTFAYCKSLETVTVSDNTEIGYKAFYMCENLRSCNIPKCNTYLSAPFDHTAIESIEIHDEVT